MKMSVAALLLALIVAVSLSPSVEGRVVPGLGGGRRCLQHCIHLYDPVCGTDGNRYSNSCFLGIAQCMDHSLRRAPDHVCGLDGALM
ncbi:serine protease inhibitor Kazal-type 1-like [Branchiostoma lanceolatum]|uniref:serine protease inhibitor Kazal-type 1-like n=1 Tax=Branchiostoma lanceolatum TaxID=7740 RepID=UPI003451D2C1